MAQKTIASNFLVAQASALVLYPATNDEVTVRGLTGLTLPLGFEMSNTVVSEMGRRIDLIVPSGGTYPAIEITANFVPGDPTQQVFQSAALNSTKLTDLRFYLKQGCDFATLDLINDSGGGYYIGTYSPPSVASKNELYQNQISILPAGSSVLFIAHSTAGAGADLDFLSEATTTAGATITQSAGSWVDMGFEAGDVIIIDYMTSGTDPLYAEIASLTATVLTLTEATGDSASITDVTGPATCQIHGATAIEVTGLDTTCD